MDCKYIKADTVLPSKCGDQVLSKIFVLWFYSSCMCSTNSYHWVERGLNGVESLMKMHSYFLNSLFNEKFIKRYFIIECIFLSVRQHYDLFLVFTFIRCQLMLEEIQVNTWMFSLKGWENLNLKFVT